MTDKLKLVFFAAYFLLAPLAGYYWPHGIEKGGNVMYFMQDGEPVDIRKRGDITLKDVHIEGTTHYGIHVDNMDNVNIFLTEEEFNRLMGGSRKGKGTP